MKMQNLNLDLEKATFIKNSDNTYTVYQRIGDNGILKIPRVSIELKAEALIDETTGDFWKWIDTKKPSKISILLGKAKAFLTKGRKK